MVSLSVGQFGLKRYQEHSLSFLSQFIKAIKNHNGNLAEAWYQYQFHHNPLNVSSPPKWNERRDGTGQSIPHGCLMLPTGGGKTLVGVLGVTRVQQDYLGRGKGLVVWVVPSVAIYKQTIKQFRDVTSPLHQTLKACAGGVSPKILEKTDRFTQQDLQQSLCILVLIQQAFNVKKKENRKLYEPCSLYSSFFPRSDEVLGHKALKQAVPNLDVYTQEDYTHFVRDLDEYPEIKPSLANVLKITRPIIVVDECHKSTTKKALENTEAFNPSFILELSATPFDNSNLIYQAKGLDLWREQMIKLPIHLKSWESISWQQCLQQAYDKRRELEKAATDIRDEHGVYIRPIMIIRVQRTEEDKHDSKYVHSTDVKTWLLNTGVTESEIAIRSAKRDEIGDRDLMNDQVATRYIITKDALREGWDCPFAYVLCNLDNTNTDVSMTQMLGRILRQPYAKIIEPKAELNEAFVFCRDQNVNKTFNSIVEGLQSQGMGDLRHALLKVGDEPIERKKHTVKRKERFASEQILLPKVLFHPRKLYNNPSLADSEPLNWTEHLASHFDYSAIKIDIPSIIDEIERSAESSVQIGYNKSKKGEYTLGAMQVKLDLQFLTPDVPSPVTLYRQLYPIIPSAFIAHKLFGNSIEKIANSKRPYDTMDKIKDTYQAKLFNQSEDIFRKWLSEGIISFQIIEQANKNVGQFYLPSSFEVSTATIKDEEALQFEKNLYDPMLNEFFNKSEKDVAGYLDSQASVKWWHRLFARQNKEYRLQGWKPNAIYPDFLIKRVKNTDTGKLQYVLLESKGLHLKDNNDTVYKKALLEVLAQHYDVVGTLKTPDSMYNLVLELSSGWKVDLDTVFSQQI